MTLSALTSDPYQVQVITGQVWRNGVWVNLPIQNASGNMQVGSAGTLTFTMLMDPTDSRTTLYEGERIRFSSGIIGAPISRRFTGFVDSIAVTDSAKGTQRVITCSDNFKELKDAILLSPRVYDGLQPNAAIADAINQGLQFGQLKLYNDAGQALLDVNNYDQANGNGILDAPIILNDDLSTYTLPQGILGSTNTIQTASQSVMIPPPSGSNTYIEVEIMQYIIASTLSSNFTLLEGGSLPPPSGSYYLDTYNGVAYFNPADQDRNYTFSCFYYSSPLFGFPVGSSVGDVVAQIADQTGQNLTLDPYGKFHVVPATKPMVPARILGKDQYIQNGIQINRDRRNVIICEGWDGNCGGLIIGKAVLLEDSTLAPPQGLGKRSYVVFQNKSWATQYAVNKAAYYAAQNIGQRGKVISLTIIDDPSLQLYDVIGFHGTVKELSNGDFFVIQGIQWQVGMSNGQQVAMATVTGNLIPGQSTIYIGPASATLGTGNMDYSIDATPIFNCALSPAGGTTAANFSISNTGLHLQYEVGNANIVESITIFGSDGTEAIIESGVTRAANTILNLPMPSGTFKAGVFYIVQLWVVDVNGNVGAFYSSIFALP